MSSIYRVLCLSHDPAVIAADGDWQRPEAAERAIEAGIDGHEQCDLLLGRYSTALIELGCPASTGERRERQHRCLAHGNTRWVDLGWLRMLALAQEQPAGTALRRATEDHVGNCWPTGRLGRLRAELSLGERSEHQPCGHPGPAADDPSNPCALPLGHDLHRDQDGCSWPTPVRFEPKAACPDLPGHETHSPPCGFFQRPEAAALTRPAPAPCSINHNCPGQPHPAPLTARNEARCQSQHRRDGEPLVQCARAVHPDDAHTDYDTDKPGRKPAGVPWFVWGADSEAGALAEVAPDPMAVQDRIEAALRETRDRWMPDGDPVYIAALVSDALTAIRRG